ncbi:ATPase [Curtobacterium sp. Leaf183]|nr:ATP-binding protein [Curtobacterium sp. Leaf183]KQS06127.1 ATPase [Curtobacterium sp. Leaf183]
MSPFSPGYGRRPLVFGGHDEELAELTAVFETLDFGENQSVLISGLHGAGKTSMLAKLQDSAKDNGWLVISDDASAGLMDRVMETAVPTLLSELSHEARGRLTGLGIWQLNAQWEYVDRHREVKPLLRRDLVALSAELATQRPAGLLITIDEVSSGKVRLRELSRFALEVSHAISEGANVMIVFAGIKVDLDALVEQEHTTFLRRSRELDFRRLTPRQTQHVLAESIHIGGKQIEPEALTLLATISQGYPYLVQLAGDFAWRSSGSSSTITTADAHAAHSRAITAVERRVISRVYQDLSDKDQEFVTAMAADEGGRSKIADIVRRMGVSDQYVQVYKKRLIESGYVQADGRGHVVFSLPYLGDYIRSMTAEPSGAPVSDDWGDFPPPSAHAPA